MRDSEADLLRPNLRNELVADAGRKEGSPSSNGVSEVTDGKTVVSQSASAEGEESRKPNIARRPPTPSKADVEEHLPLYLEYRSWCPHCIAGKGISD